MEDIYSEEDLDRFLEREAISHELLDRLLINNSVDAAIKVVHNETSDHKHWSHHIMDAIGAYGDLRLIQVLDDWYSRKANREWYKGRYLLLRSASLFGHMDVLEYFLNSGRFEACREEFDNFLYQACAGGNYDIVTLLFSKGIMSTYQDQRIHNSMNAAIKHSHAGIIDILLVNGIKITETQLESALSFASVRKSVFLTFDQKVIEKIADVLGMTVEPTPVPVKEPLPPVVQILRYDSDKQTTVLTFDILVGRILEFANYSYDSFERIEREENQMYELTLDTSEIVTRGECLVVCPCREIISILESYNLPGCRLSLVTTLEEINAERIFYIPNYMDLRFIWFPFLKLSNPVTTICFLKDSKNTFKLGANIGFRKFWACGQSPEAVVPRCFRNDVFALMGFHLAVSESAEEIR